ncbi:hypothetical protein EYF80_041799 [Liparis tanakae]|uniref:Uncharacterized protein n=1 Tax=Liparis tanakae TaxID=230148 RepID=A0A4Z2G331_9TELE|nr:hypothetical protein EYF80_041799 [Liparis tanakae]
MTSFTFILLTFISLCSFVLSSFSIEPETPTLDPLTSAGSSRQGQISRDDRHCDQHGCPPGVIEAAQSGHHRGREMALRPRLPPAAVWTLYISHPTTCSRSDRLGQPLMHPGKYLAAALLPLPVYPPICLPRGNECGVVRGNRPGLLVRPKAKKDFIH